MFKNLGDRLGDIFSKLTKRGALSEEDVTAAMREVRIALLEADVALPVVKDFIKAVKAEAVGQEVIKSVTPGQMVIKIVNDHLVKVLSGVPFGKNADEETDGEIQEVRSKPHQDSDQDSESKRSLSDQNQFLNQPLNLSTKPPAVIMMAGLQGSGKTTFTAKIARFLKEKYNKKVLMASTDIYRPAAREQLATLGEQIEVQTLPIIQSEHPLDITKRALEVARLEAFDVLFIDTAGRLHIDDDLMDELQDIRDLAKPIETLLATDAMTGQDAVNVAATFQDKIGITGTILSRIDGDARGGAALSMRYVTGVPIKFLGTGERVHELEVFHPDRIASRILDMGDVVSLVEKAAETIDQEEAEAMALQMQKGVFTLDDMAKQLSQISKMGGMTGIMGMLPGIGKLQDKIDAAGINDNMVAKQIAMIRSMTKKERQDAKLLNGSRKRRIAAGSGASVPEVNRLLKQYKDMSLAMKRFKKLGKKGLMRQGLAGLFKK